MAAYPQGGNGQALMQEVQQVLADDVKNGVPADLVEAEKRHELADEEFQKNSISGLAMEWSNALAVEGRQSPEDDIRAIEKVTIEDVNRVARKYLAPSERDRGGADAAAIGQADFVEIVWRRGITRRRRRAGR